MREKLRETWQHWRRIQLRLSLRMKLLQQWDVLLESYFVFTFQLLQKKHFPFPHIWTVNIKAHCYQLSVLLSTASTLVLINAPSPCVQPRASAAAAAAAAAATHKQRSLVVVTSLSSLSIFASILFTHLFLNIYPTPIVQWLKKRIFICLPSQIRERLVCLSVWKKGVIMPECMFVWHGDLLLEKLGLL